jgi:hypothetical protein
MIGLFNLHVRCWASENRVSFRTGFDSGAIPQLMKTRFGFISASTQRTRLPENTVGFSSTNQNLKIIGTM